MKKNYRSFVQETSVKTTSFHGLFDEFAKMSNEERRYYWFAKREHPYKSYTSIKVDGPKLSYCEYTKRYAYGCGKVYKAPNKFTVDFGVDRETGKVWMNCKDMCIIKIRMAEIKDFEFLRAVPDKFCTKSILKLVLLGKLTNPEQVVKKYLQYIKHSDWPWKKCLEYVNRQDRQSPLTLSVLGEVVTNPIAVLQNPDIVCGYNPLLRDMIDQALALSVKFDPRWSTSRLESVHMDWTRALMGKELEGKEDLPIWPEEFVSRIKEHGAELLNTELRVFEEGTFMHHCIYTNYFRRIKGKRYIAMHVNLGKESFTIGMFKDNKKYILEQAKCTYNQSLSEDARKWLNAFIESIEDILKDMYTYAVTDGSIKDIEPIEPIEILF